MDRPDDPAGRVRAGNEWVVAARLADAKFFFEKDRATPLADRREGLAKLTFQEKLGSYAEKSARLIALADSIARAAGVSDLSAVRSAAELLKVDLATDMVKEFTDLQGVVGGLYARAEGAPEAVWQAIYDQYRPAGAKDALPRGAVGQVTALADRLDTLAGFFGLGLIPTGIQRSVRSPARGARSRSPRARRRGGGEPRSGSGSRLWTPSRKASSKGCLGVRRLRAFAERFARSSRRPSISWSSSFVIG